MGLLIKINPNDESINKGLSSIMFVSFISYPANPFALHGLVIVMKLSVVRRQLIDGLLWHATELTLWMGHAIYVPIFFRSLRN